MERRSGESNDLGRRAERLLSHAEEAAPFDEGDHAAAVRFWHYPSSAPHRSWTVYVRGSPASVAPALLREVRWAALPTVEVRDALLPASSWQALVRSATKLLVPVTAGESDVVVLDRETFGVEFDSHQNLLRLQWRGGHEAAWGVVAQWARHWRQRLEEALGSTPPTATTTL
jgi:hypothetical protein